MRLAGLALLTLGCTRATPEGGVVVPGTPPVFPEVELPAVGDLPEQVEPPDPFVAWANGEELDPTDWDARTSELLVLYQHYAFGWSADPVTTELVERTEDASAGERLIHLHGRFGPDDGEARELLVALWLPDGAPRAIVLGLNKCGNASVREGALDAGAWVQEDCDPDPGSRSAYWNIDAALAAGFGVATVHQSEFHPDDPSATGGMLDWPLPLAGDDDRWGVIGTWAFGLSRAVDLLDGETGAVPVVVMGHSRRGKTALWATAQDARIDGVWAHQSGTGGASLSRHREGETIGAMTTLFPHWFDDVFPAFDGQETRLPFDQHLLLALAAPRPVRVTDGEDDAWADPEGARQAVELAVPVFDALGGPEPVWALRPGVHEVTPQDWLDTLDWLDAHF